MTALKHLLANHTKYYSEASLLAQSIRDVLSSTREAGGFENEQILRGGVSGEHWSADLSKKADFQETYVLRPLGHHRPAARSCENEGGV